MAGYSNPGRTVGAPGNFAQSGRLGFGVGDPDFLSSEESKVRAYWRGLEYGSTKFLGRVITGLWSNASGPRGGLITGGELDVFNRDVGGGQQKLVPFVRPQEELVIGARRALGYLLGTGQMMFTTHRALSRRLDQGDLRVPTAGVIKRPIAAQNAYREGVKRFDPVQREKEAIAQVFKGLGFTAGGFRAGRHGTVTGGQQKVSFLSLRTQRRQPISTSAFLGRTGFLSGHAISGYNYSLVNIDRTFQERLHKANRLLAEGLAVEIAEVQKERIKRQAVSTGRLTAATLSPKNRFPS